MTTIDWAIVALAAVMAPVGYRQGLLVAGLGLGGFVAGAVLGTRLAPLLLSDGSASPYAPGFALVAGLIVGGTFALVLEGLAFRIRERLPRGFSSLDSVGGAVAFAGLALVVAWVAGALALNAPALSGIRADVQRSVILGEVNEVLPPSGPILNVLNRINPTPTLSGPSANVAAPAEGILSEPGVLAAGESVVKVLGTACGLNLSGSGWVGEPGLVVTNAHVIAGQSDTFVLTRDGAELDAEPLVYRPDDDVAVLRVDGLEQPPLPLANEPQSGAAAAVLGYPSSGDFQSVAARLGSTEEVTSQDSYGRGPVQRGMTSFRGAVIGGNSGGPVVDASGSVVTTVFAATVDARPPEGLGVPNRIVREALDAAGSEPTGTGACG
ncbi:MAG: MarP family serine protease [Actinomycetota bacterium]|nr:MarP family serine protease [Actinomycetota bacterium]